MILIYVVVKTILHETQLWAFYVMGCGPSSQLNEKRKTKVPLSNKTQQPWLSQLATITVQDAFIFENDLETVCSQPQVKDLCGAGGEQPVTL